MYDLGHKDGWGVFLYFLGLAGTGKSTLLRLLSRLYEARDVGYMNNALQRTFALDGLEDKLLFLALDIDEHFQLDQATFQSMVVGEEVPITRKFKKPFTKVWTTPGAAAGNKLPNWRDNGGSLGRRLTVVEFLKLVTKCDPNLFQKCVGELDRFLKVINSAYLDMCRQFSGKGIKEVLPKKFKMSEKKALLELDILGAFILNSCHLDQREYAEGDDDMDPLHSSLAKNDPYIISYKVFCKSFKEYCNRLSVKAQPLNYTFCNPVFTRYRCTHVESPAADDPLGQTESYILGLRLKEEFLAHALDV